jgi:DNA-binding CsgD family transcriptional regulator
MKFNVSEHKVWHEDKGNGHFAKRLIAKPNKPYLRSNELKKYCLKRLSKREILCLQWAARGLASEQTAGVLKLEVLTVRTYLKQVREKLKCHTMAHAVYEGITRGYL